MGAREGERSEAAERVAAVEDEVVPGERPRAVFRIGRLRKNGLFKSACGAAIPPMPLSIPTNAAGISHKMLEDAAAEK